MYVLVTCHYAYFACQDSLSYGWMKVRLTAIVVCACMSVPTLMLHKANHLKFGVFKLLYE